jgi:DNA-binding response OmpR family regulator
MHTPLTILIIDDEPSFTSGLARLLRHDGSTVDTAVNGHLALAHLQAQRYDVVLCDLRMPALNGVAFYTILSRQHAYLRKRVIFLTGDTLGADSTAFLEQCGQPWVYKPCEVAAIRSAIQEMLRTAASTDPGTPGEGSADTEESRPEEGTLSILWRGQCYQVRYASNNPYGEDSLMRTCADEDTLDALLHHLGIEAEALHHACAIARQGGVAVLRILASPGQIQACFPATA